MENFKMIAAFCPTGTLVEFDTNTSCQHDMPAGIGVVRDCTASGDKQVLALEVIKLTTGHQLFTDQSGSLTKLDISSRYVTGIFQRWEGCCGADGRVIYAHPLSGFGKPTRVHDHLVLSYFCTLVDTLAYQSEYGFDLARMVDQLRRQYPGVAFYRKRFLKQWFRKNINRHLISQKQFNRDKRDWCAYLYDASKDV